MCGIVGYVGHDNAKDIIIDGLKKIRIQRLRLCRYSLC